MIDMVLQQIREYLGNRIGDREVTVEARREAAQSAPQWDGVQVYWGSLARDGDAVVAADVEEKPSLLRCGGDGVEVRPFGPADREAVRDFAERIDRSFLPRPQREKPAVAVGNRHPEVSLPAAFEAFRQVLDQRGVNIASTVQLSATREMTTDARLAGRSGENPTEIGHTRVSIEHLYHAGLWAAIRAGWRDGYTAEADHFIISGKDEGEIGRSIEQTKEAIRAARGYTKFTTDTSRLFRLEADERHPRAWSGAEVEGQFEKVLTAQERKWVVGEFGRGVDIAERRYEFGAGEIRRLAVKFAESLKLNEQLYDYIVEVKGSREFDFEPSIDEAETLTTAKELIFYMHWLAERGRRAQLVPPNLGFKKRQAYPETLERLEPYVAHKMWPELLPRVGGEFGGRPLEELGARVRELAEVARHFDGTLSIHSGSGKQASVLQMIGRSTGGRVNYKISGELQLQMLDVLAERPPGSEWRGLYERMVDRCVQFAEAGACREESELAAVYRNQVLAYYLGDYKRGRVDGNLFLVFWLGNLVGTRDVDGRFFKDKLDELPRGLVEEVRRRNSEYIVWLAGELRG